QVARTQQRKLPVSLRARVALGLVCAAILAVVDPGTPRAQEAFREVSLTREEAMCPRYRLMVNDGERTDCWQPGLTLAAVDEPPASPPERKRGWSPAGLRLSPGA